MWSAVACVRKLNSGEITVEYSHARVRYGSVRVRHDMHGYGKIRDGYGNKFSESTLKNLFFYQIYDKTLLVDQLLEHTKNLF